MWTFEKGIKLDLICMEIKRMKNKRIFAAKFFTKGTCTETKIDFSSRISKSYVPFTRKIPMVMFSCAGFFLQVRSAGKQIMFLNYESYVSLNVCESFRFSS